MVFDTFTLTQTPTTKNLYLYPDGAVAGRSQCTAFGAALNYACVNEHRDVQDDDDRYVYWTGASVGSDLYTVDNHVSESGTINYVKVYSRVKSHLYNQASTGVYKTLLALSGVTVKSSEIDLITDYNGYSHQFNSTPSGSSWNWWDIDNMQIGFEVSSPVTVYGSADQVLRPVANGRDSEWVAGGLGSGAGVHWQMVDEEVANNDYDYLYAWQGYPDPAHYHEYFDVGTSSNTGAINYVSVFYRYTNYALGGYTGEYIRSCIYPSSGTYYGTIHTPTEDWLDASDIWTSCPSSGNPWRWGNDIDYLEIGLDGRYCACTQIYALVNYNLSTNPEIRTTQLYAVVNYTPGASTCSLSMPHTYTLGQSRVISELKPEGGRIIYPVQRESMSLTLLGEESDIFGGSAFARLSCVRTMKDQGVYVTLSGFTDGNVNGDWLIEEFTFEKNKENPNIYDYTMVCEHYEAG